jgi:murein DD-endopeptidase MepM/ murein hydrolase activator NlpD
MNKLPCADNNIYAKRKYRRKQMEKNNNNIKKQNRFAAVSIILTVLVVVGTIWAAESFYKDTTEEIKSNNESNLSLDSLIPDAAEESAENETQPEATQTEAASETQSSEDESASEVSKNDISALMNPVSSTTITMAFSYNTTPVISATFNEYRSDHTGIDIQAAVGEEVKCAYDGTVVEVRDDPRLGKQ